MVESWDFYTIFKVRSPEPFLTIFEIFSLKSHQKTMVTSSQQWQTTHDSEVLPIRPIFRVRSPDPFLAFLTIFSLKSQQNMMVTSSQRVLTRVLAGYSRLGGTADSADFQGLVTRPVCDDFCHFFHSNRTQGRGFTLCAFNAFLPLVFIKNLLCNNQEG